VQTDPDEAPFKQLATRILPALMAEKERAGLQHLIVDMSQSLLHARSISLALVKNNMISCVSTSGDVEKAQHDKKESGWLEVPPRSHVGEAIQLRKPVCANAVETNEDGRTIKVRKSWVPVLARKTSDAQEEPRNDVVAILEICTKKGSRGSSALALEKELCVALAAVAAQALSTMEERLVDERRIRRAEAMADAAVAFWELDHKAVCEAVCTSACKYMGAEAADIFVLEDEPKDAEYPCMVNGADPTIVIPFQKGIVGDVAATGRSLNLFNAHTDSRYNPRYDRPVSSKNLKPVSNCGR